MLAVHAQALPAYRRPIRVSVRHAMYRDRAGYLVVGVMPHAWPQRIFTMTRSSADHIAAKLRRGESIELRDFEE